MRWRARTAWVNATFVARAGDGFAIRTVERGAGETGSCGSGALSAFVAFSGAGDRSGTAFRFSGGETLVVRQVAEPRAAIEVRGRCALLAHEAARGAFGDERETA